MSIVHKSNYSDFKCLLVHSSFLLTCISIIITKYNASKFLSEIYTSTGTLIRVMQGKKASQTVELTHVMCFTRRINSGFSKHI